MKQKESLDRVIKTFYLRGEINSESTAEVIGELLSTDESPVLLVINSGGGDVHDGIALLDAIKWSGRDVSCLAIGKCFSMAFNIFIACKKRFSFENTIFMTHGVSSNLEGKFYHSDMKTLIDQHHKLDEKLIKDIKVNSKITEKVLRENIHKKRDVFYSAQDGLKLKFVDKIIKRKSDLIDYL